MKRLIIALALLMPSGTFAEDYLTNKEVLFNGRILSSHAFDVDMTHANHSIIVAYSETIWLCEFNYIVASCKEASKLLGRAETLAERLLK